MRVPQAPQGAQPRDPAPERWAHRIFGYEVQRGLILGVSQDWGNRTVTLKGHTQHLAHFRTQSKSRNLIGALARPTFLSWSIFCRVLEGLHLSSETWTLVEATGSHTGSFFSQVNAGVGRSHPGIFLLVLWHQDLALLHRM